MWQNIWRQQFDWVQSTTETPDGGYILAGSSHLLGKKIKRGLGDFWFKIVTPGTIILAKKTIERKINGICKIYNSHLDGKLHMIRLLIFPATKREKRLIISFDVG
jgi:hypothetical protein